MRYVEINDQKYPFKFGQRELQTVSMQFADLADEDEDQIEYDKVGQRMAESFDLFLHAFHTASKKGCRRHNKQNEEDLDPLSEIELEDAIDDNPELYDDLFEAFNNSRTAKHMEERADGEKKPNS